MHPFMMNAMEEILDLVSPKSGVNLIILIGPTGVGKTALCEKLIQRTARDYADQLNSDTCIIPAIMVAAPSIGAKAFSMKHFMEIMLEALCEPMIDRKLTPDHLTEGYKLPFHMTSHRITHSAVRLATGKALQERNTQYVIVDEAAHILEGTSIATQINALKSLSDMTNSKFVLVGSYDLYKIISVNGQLARRCHVVHFPRYANDTKIEKHHFTKVAQKLSSLMELRSEVVLDPYLPTLLEASVGCIGILKDSLQRAYSLCLRRQSGKWTSKALESSLLRKSSTKTILREALDGEEMISENEVWRL